MDTAAPPNRTPRHPGSNRGVWTIVAIFALGFAVLTGLYLSPRSRSPALPPGTPRGLPSRPVTGVLLDCRPLGASPDAVMAAVRLLDAAPDLVLLLDVESALVPAVVEALGFQPAYHPSFYQRVRPDADAKQKVGLCILSRHRLYDGRPIRAQNERPVGVAAHAVIDGRAISIALADVRDSPTGLQALLADYDLAAGRWAEELVVRGSSPKPAGNGATTLAAAEPAAPPADWVTVLRRQEGPPGLVFRIGAQADPATRPGR